MNDPCHPNTILLLGKVLLVLGAMGGVSTAVAQRPNVGGGALTGKIYGRVLDAETRKGAEYATASVHAVPGDSLVTGTLVRGNGDLMIEGVRPGKYAVKIGFIGYADTVVQVTVTRRDPEQDIGNILLRPNSELLKEVEVVSERGAMVMKVDRRVYNVERDLSARGGNAEDALRNIPGLTVDFDGNVKLRNASPRLLIDGRPTTMTLDQIPTEEIDHVEVITNPSVAYDADATGGIINIVLKKNRKPGYFGRLEGGVGTNGRYQGSANLQVREGRFGFDLSYGYRTGKNRTNGYTDRTDLLHGEVVGGFTQNGVNVNSRGGHSGRFGVDFEMNNRNTLSFSQSIRSRDHGSQESQEFSIRDGTGATTSTGLQLNDQSSTGTHYTTRLGFRRIGPEDGKEFTADVTYNASRRETRNVFSSTVRFPNGDLDPAASMEQVNVGTNNEDQWVFQTDMVDPIGERNKLEYGLKSSIAMRPSVTEFYAVDADSGEEFLDSLLSNEYDITDMVNAAYLSWTHGFNDHWSMQAGLRFETTQFKGELVGKGETFTYTYPRGGNDLDRSLFPAIHVARRWDKEGGRELQFNVSRKIQRPNFWQIYPFISFRDTRNYRIGDPSLAPEISTIGEITHLLPFGKKRSNWLTSIFGRYTEDVITGFTTPSAEDSTLLITSYINGDRSWSSGWENTIRYVPVAKTELMLSGTVQYTELTAIAGTSRNSGFGGEVKASLTQRLPKELALQLNGEYEFPEIFAQGRSLANYSLNASASKDFGKAWSVVISVRDIFNTRRWGSSYETDRFITENSRRWEQRNARLTITWKFGERDSSLFGRRQRGRGDSGGDEGGEM